MLLSAMALLSVGPLRSAFEALPLIPYLGTFFLFLAPGAVLVHRFFGEHLSGPVVVPVSFALSAGIFALVGVPFLMSHGSLDLYLWVSGTILATSQVAAVLGILRREPSAKNGAPVRTYLGWLWIPFLLLSAVVVSTRRRVTHPYDDIWIYLANVREFLNTEHLALHEPYFGNLTGTSRVQINGWLLEQAAFSRISGIDPIELMLRYLVPTLVVVALLAFYALARTLFESEEGALLAASLYALGFLLHLGGLWTSRIAEDKYASLFLFVPVALVFAFLFLQTRRWRYLTSFAFFCWAIVAIHPVGLALIGLCTAGFGLFHLAVNLPDKGVWIRTVSLGGALLSFLLAPFLYLLITGDSLVAVLKSADINSNDPDVLANMVFVKKQYEDRLLELANNYYMVHPSRVLSPVILVAFLVVLPILLWRLKRDLAAHLLVGMLLVPTVVCFVPPVATFFGNYIVLPGQMWRLAWPIPLAALLFAGWMLSEMVRHAQTGLESSGTSRRVARFLSPVLLCALMVAAAPKSVDDAKALYGAAKNASSSGICFDPAFRWIQDNIKEASVVLAPDAENTCIPAYSAKANVVSLRGSQILVNRAALERRAPGQIEVPQGAVDVRSFFSHSTLAEKIEILRRYDVDYVMVPADLPLGRTLERRAALSAIDTPGERYDLYVVDRGKLRFPATVGGVPEVEVAPD